VHELFCPLPGQPYTLDILFFHGLCPIGISGEMHWRTFASTDGQQCWPADKLPQHAPWARVLSVSYNSSAWTGKSINNVGRELLKQLAIAGVGRGVNVLLVGHSLGGLVIKQLCVAAERARKADGAGYGARLLNSIRGTFFMSTPHSSSNLVNVVEVFGLPMGPLLELLCSFNADAGDLAVEFDSMCHKRSWPAWHVHETKVCRL
jgi:pimeloyl-ACP methyl ester carboxylesterase